MTTSTSRGVSAAKVAKFRGMCEKERPTRSIARRKFMAAASIFGAIRVIFIGELQLYRIPAELDGD